MMLRAEYLALTIFLKNLQVHQSKLSLVTRGEVKTFELFSLFRNKFGMIVEDIKNVFITRASDKLY